MIFTKITSEQVNSVHQLYILLRKLRVIGLIKTSTEQVRITEMGKPIRYTLKFHSYDETMKGVYTPEEHIDSIFRHCFLMTYTQQTE